MTIPTISYTRLAVRDGRKTPTLCTQSPYTMSVAPIRIRTGVWGFKVTSDNHYTIGANSIFNPYTRGLHRVGFEPTRC